MQNGLTMGIASISKLMARDGTLYDSEEQMIRAAYRQMVNERGSDSTVFVQRRVVSRWDRKAERKEFRLALRQIGTMVLLVAALALSLAACGSVSTTATTAHHSVAQAKPSTQTDPTTCQVGQSENSALMADFQTYLHTYETDPIDAIPDVVSGDIQNEMQTISQLSNEDHNPSDQGKLSAMSNAMIMFNTVMADLASGNVQQADIDAHVAHDQLGGFSDALAICS